MKWNLNVEEARLPNLLNRQQTPQTEDHDDENGIVCDIVHKDISGSEIFLFANLSVQLNQYTKFLPSS